MMVSFVLWKFLFLFGVAIWYIFTMRVKRMKSFGWANQKCMQTIQGPSAVCMHVAHPHSLLASRKIIIRMALHEQVCAVVYSMASPPGSCIAFRLCGCGPKPASTDIWCNQARSKTPRIHYQFLSLYHLSICFSIWIICKWTFELLREKRNEWASERETHRKKNENTNAN